MVVVVVVVICLCATSVKGIILCKFSYSTERLNSPVYSVLPCINK